MSDKTCTVCGGTNPIDDFTRSIKGKDGRTSQCKSCCATYAKAYREQYKKRARLSSKKTQAKWKANGERIVDWITLKYDGTPCLDCNGVFNWCAMDFDHRPGEVKELIIGTIGIQKATPERVSLVEKEIAKCDLVCANCHRVRTYVTRNVLFND